MRSCRLRFFRLAFAIAVFGAVAFAGPHVAVAQEGGEDGDTGSQPLGGQLQQIEPLGGDVTGNPRVERGRGTAGRTRPSPPNASSSVSDGEELEPYGSQLFNDQTALDRTLSVNPDYEIQSGDRIAVQIWGARTFSDTLTVDMQGNIFLPEIGPIRLQGVRNAELNEVVSSAVNRVYSRNVNVYTNLLGTQPIGVYVTGAVNAPGQYAGNRTDSLLYYLTRANGIDAARGSYRRIHIKRDGERIATADLYEFLRRGELPNVTFNNNDTILVEQQQSTVRVSGIVQNAYKFEIDTGEATGQTIIDLARPLSSASHVRLRGVRSKKSFSTYLQIEDFRTLNVRSGDEIEFSSDYVPQEMVIDVTGHTDGPSSFTVPRGTTLGTVAQLVQVDPNVADLKDIYLRRDSVAERQKQAIERALQELQRTVLTTPSTTTSEAEVRVQEAELVQKFVQQAREVEPEGRVALDDAQNWEDVRLEEGDEIVIPQQTDIVLISGEVKVPQSVVFNDTYSVDDYIDQAGGLSNRGGDRVIVIRQDGSVHTGNKPIRPGDQIMVLPEVQTKFFAIAKDLVEVIFRVAVSAGTVINAGS